MTSPDCPYVEEDLNRFVDGELPLLDAERLDRHAAACKHCAGTIRRLAAVHDLLEGYPLEDVPADLADGALALYRTLEPGAARTSLPRGRWWIPGTLAVFGLGWLAGSWGGGPSQPPLSVISVTSPVPYAGKPKPPADGRIRPKVQMGIPVGHPMGRRIERTEAQASWTGIDPAVVTRVLPMLPLESAEQRCLLRASDDPQVALGNRPWAIDFDEQGMVRALDTPLPADAFQLVLDRVHRKHYLLGMENVYQMDEVEAPGKQPVVRSIPRPLIGGLTQLGKVAEPVVTSSIAYDAKRDRLVRVDDAAIRAYHPATTTWETIRENKDLDPRWPWGVDRLVWNHDDDLLYGFDQGRRMLVALDHQGKLVHMVELDPELTRREALGSPFDRRVQLFDGGEHMVVVAMRAESPTQSPTHALWAIRLEWKTGELVREKRIWPMPVGPR